MYKGKTYQNYTTTIKTTHNKNSTANTNPELELEYITPDKSEKFENIEEINDQLLRPDETPEFCGSGVTEIIYYEVVKLVYGI